MMSRDVTLSYHRVRGLYFLAVAFTATIICAMCMLFLTTISYPRDSLKRTYDGRKLNKLKKGELAFQLNKEVIPSDSISDIDSQDAGTRSDTELRDEMSAEEKIVIQVVKNVLEEATASVAGDKSPDTENRCKRLLSVSLSLSLFLLSISFCPSLSSQSLFLSLSPLSISLSLSFFPPLSSSLSLSFFPLSLSLSIYLSHTHYLFLSLSRSFSLSSSSNLCLTIFLFASIYY